MMVAPGFRMPFCSASSIIASAMRSFTEPPGLKYSTLAIRGVSMPFNVEYLLSSSNGVLPISSVNCFAIFVIILNFLAVSLCCCFWVQRYGDFPNPTIPIASYSSYHKYGISIDQGWQRFPLSALLYPTRMLFSLAVIANAYKQKTLCVGQHLSPKSHWNWISCWTLGFL